MLSLHFFNVIQIRIRSNLIGCWFGRNQLNFKLKNKHEEKVKDFLEPFPGEDEEYHFYFCGIRLTKKPDEKTANNKRRVGQIKLKPFLNEQKSFKKAAKNKTKNKLKPFFNEQCWIKNLPRNQTSIFKLCFFFKSEGRRLSHYNHIKYIYWDTGHSFYFLNIMS